MPDEKEVVTEQPKVETEPPAPNPEQLQAELKAAQAKIQELQKGLQTAGQTIKERTAKLNDLDSLRGEVNLLRDSIKEIYTTKLEKDENTGEVKLNMPRPDLTGKFEAISQQAKIMAEINARKDRVEALGLAPDSEEYLEIQDLATRLNFTLADKKIAKIEAAKKQPSEEKPTETEEQRIKKLVEEQLHQKMIEAGLLTPEGASPSASGGSRDELDRRYALGEIDRKTYMEGLQKKS